MKNKKKRKEKRRRRKKEEEFWAVAAKPSVNIHTVLSHTKEIVQSSESCWSGSRKSAVQISSFSHFLYSFILFVFFSILKDILRLQIRSDAVLRLQDHHHYHEEYGCWSRERFKQQITWERWLEIGKENHWIRMRDLKWEANVRRRSLTSYTTRWTWKKFGQ